MSERSFRRVCVFCGSSEAIDASYREAARALGECLVRRGIGLVYGGGDVGLMGEVARTVMKGGGEVLGVIPEKLHEYEKGTYEITELFVVDSMRARKAMMSHLSDGFVALPGGLGTLEELFEVTTLTQLNYHQKPVGLLNTGGYYDKLVGFLAHAGREGFIRPQHRSLVRVSDDVEALIDDLLTCEIPQFPG